MLKVSVIVPVYNPGSNVDDCIRSLVDQSLPRDEYEVIFVDDGSTDGTRERLDNLAGEHPHVRVEHIPNSGWPGRPRNVGLDIAAGEYVYFVDNDDWIGGEALERLHATAVRDGADVVIGKVVGHGKSVPRVLFQQNREDVTLEWGPLLGLLAPQKLFRKRLLDEHGVRFPEGRRRLEDHMFVLHAYFHAGGISILADYPCYHWVLRRDDEAERDVNASLRPFDPPGYYANLREVLDLIEQHTEPGSLRDTLLAHYYRGKMLGRVGGRKFLQRDSEYRRQLYEEVRRLALERYDPVVDTRLPFNVRVRSLLLRAGSYAALEALAAIDGELRPDARVVAVERVKGRAVVRFEARLLIGDERPIRFLRRDDRVFWIPPAPLVRELPEGAFEVTSEIFESSVKVILRSRFEASAYLLPTDAEIRLEPTDRDAAVTPVLVGEARVEPAKVAAGSAVPPGLWEARASVSVCGFTATDWLQRRRGEKRWSVVITRTGRVAGRLRRLVAWTSRRLRRTVRNLASGRRLGRAR
jgi:glycosyltransferase involved in cell wall biosynthesis